MTGRPLARGAIRSVLGDHVDLVADVVYAHEHLIIDSPLIESRFPHIHLHDVEAAVAEVVECRSAGATVFVDAMPAAAGRDAVRLAQIASRTGTCIVVATGLHHDRYYGETHWSNRIPVEELARLFIADLLDGIDEFDYTGPIVRRTDHRAGFLKVATSGGVLSDRDRRSIRAVSLAAAHTGAPVMTHCEGGFGAIEQVSMLTDLGVPPRSILVSHVDKAGDLDYLVRVARTGVLLELDQALRQHEQGASSFSIRAIAALADAGFADQLAVGTDGARRTLWRSLGGSPGLAWLASELPRLLGEAELDDENIRAVASGNALSWLTWRTVS